MEQHCESKSKDQDALKTKASAERERSLAGFSALEVVLEEPFPPPTQLPSALSA